MSSKMLIDASHPEETRVVVLRGNRVEEFDFESASRKQLRGNIYLAKVTRVEPSLQAAFVDYGGNRHGFLAFSEIHPDYYQIPVADRQALIAEEQRRNEEDDAEHERRSGRRNWRHRNRGARRPQDSVRSAPVEGQTQESQSADGESLSFEQPDITTAGQPVAEAEPQGGQDNTATEAPETEPTLQTEDASGQSGESAAAPEAEPAAQAEAGSSEASESDRAFAAAEAESTSADIAAESASPEPTADAENGNGDQNGGDDTHEEEGVESIGGADALEEAQERAPRVRPRQYKIQEVIKRRQVMLVQVVKEERGTKGAALTTYLSLAGRYCVLMPNTSRGGGISRKITSAEDRSRLKEIAQDLEVPEGMGVILRTAGASRTKLEVKRDFEYLLRIWEQVRDLTLKSTAPKLVYEEGSLVKRSIRDLYSKDIEEIVVAGEHGYNEAKEFMRMLMPSHAKNVKLYRDSQPIFTRYGIESQLDAMFTPTVQLRSGGYIVINQTEALVAIDVNSGRATREHSIEDTAVKTNSEAAEEIARQLRLRDLAGLIVIDFIDMDEGRNNRTVERRVKDALKHDRARIQVGRISHFGLLEMSRQRIRSSVLESSTEKCPICGGSGHVRSVSSVTLALLRAIEETLLKGATHNLIVRTRPEVALYVLNQKRGHLRALEERFRINVTVNADEAVVGTQAFVIDRGEQVHSAEAARELAAQQSESLPPIVEAEDELIADEVAEEPAEEAQPQEGAGEGVSGESERDGGLRRRRRRRGGRGRSRGGEREPRQPQEDGLPHQPQAQELAGVQEDDQTDAGASEDGASEPYAPAAQGAPQGGEADGRRRRRRGRRGGRRHRRGENGNGHYQQHGQNGGEQQRPHGGGDTHEDEGEGEIAPGYGETHAPAPLPETTQMPHLDPNAPLASAAAASSAEQAPSRRRSTVREAVSFTPAASSAPPPAPTSAPEPAAASSASEDSGPPKRGWWARRLMGDK
jgi:ribonuclease E